MYDFADRDHAANYLGLTIVRHGDVPTLVHAVDTATPRGRKLVLHHAPLREPNMQIDKIEEFNFKPVPLGMYNFRVDGMIVEAAWLQRYPARRWKVGLDRQAICVVPVRKAEDNIVFEILRNDKRGGAGAWYWNADMADCIEGKYPSLLEALAIMGPCTRRSVAFSRNFAVTGNGKLYYRHSDQPVGKVEAGVPSLYAAYRDLEEVLEEDLR